jgi:methyltransferase (TIGR00027 family)
MAEIEHISDTARWVAVYRAMETKRPDAIFRDPFAERLAGEKGKAIVDGIKRGRATAWSMIVRTAVIDEIIVDRVRNGAVELVLNLAAGLDARPWRLPLAPTLRWVDVDLPGMLDYKTGLLRDEKTVCRYEAVPLDLREASKRRALFAQLGASAMRALVVSEGLLIYLTAEQVGALATDLHESQSFQWWVTDLANPRLLRWMQRAWGDAVKAGNASFQFAPAEGTKFFEAFGWREMSFRGLLDEARRLKREMPMMWIYRLMLRLRAPRVREQFRRFLGIVVLERD